MSASAPVLYSFRRCPYAIRARLALAASGLSVRVREVTLRNKPPELLRASPKGTVPVLVLAGGGVIDESLGIMRWALGQSDPDNWLRADAAETARLIAQNDGPFKHALDHYKYPDRYAGEGAAPSARRSAGMDILADLNARLIAGGGQLFGPAPTFADVALFPFVRQFAATDPDFWARAVPQPLQDWLAGHTGSARFHAVMARLAPWQPGEAEPLLTGG